MAADPAYLARLRAARDAILDAIAALAARPGLLGTSSYSLDGEAISKDTSFTQQLKELNDLILQEENRVSGRFELRTVRGRRYAAWR